MPHMVTMGNGQSQSIQEMLGCIERYNPDHLKTLEAYVEEQAKNNTYDLEANLAVLKLYQFNPHMLNHEITYTILLKCLTNLPHTDFVMAKCLLLPQQMKDETVQTIIELADILERTDFVLFWQRADVNKSLFRHITGFHDSIRKFVCHVIGITFQTIRRDLLKELLGGIEDSTLDKWVKQNGWKNQGNLVMIASQDEKIKTKNITEKIEFDNLGGLMAQCL
ncbi:eukaryotic translation initiation factor 3 subunit K [Musca domestica]|uniref:Eukaryotic translation initiation factor 3 subunit K n=2 Tax=Musca domestica TaxID=7370 RepID=A0A1I8MJR6_MUSDO|nr:eukaryotic translation initiation factor 3 subunit K [Musca domestica]XP_011293096.1 eukaryotic translation initiation factor 3 subunit K [Musca domestica]